MILVSRRLYWPIAIFTSASTAGAIVVLLTLGFRLWSGHPPRFTGLMEMALLMAILVAAVAAFVQLPILLLLRRLNRVVVLCAAALLGALPIVGLILLFHVPGEDPATLGGYIRFWLRVPGEFLVGCLPAMVAGAVLGAFVALKPDALPGST